MAAVSFRVYKCYFGISNRLKRKPFLFYLSSKGYEVTESYNTIVSRISTLSNSVAILNCSCLTNCSATENLLPLLILLSTGIPIVQLEAQDFNCEESDYRSTIVGSVLPVLIGLLLAGFAVYWQFEIAVFLFKSFNWHPFNK